MASLTPSRSFHILAVILLATPPLVLSGCKPWTVVPIDAAKGDRASSQSGDPATYVDSIWSAKLVPAIASSAVDARTLLAAISTSLDGAKEKYGRNSNGGAWYFNAKGEGTVLRVDTSSRNGVLEVSVLKDSHLPDLSIQIGPVLRGSALRDSTGLISFSSFVNQLQFADVADGLNNKVKQTVLAPLDIPSLVGKTVSFVGSFEMESATRPFIRNLVPVQLTVVAR